MANLSASTAYSPACDASTSVVTGTARLRLAVMSIPSSGMRITDQGGTSEVRRRRVLRAREGVFHVAEVEARRYVHPPCVLKASAHVNSDSGSRMTGAFK